MTDHLPDFVLNYYKKKRLQKQKTEMNAFYYY